MQGAYSLRDEIIAKGETQTAVFLKLFERLSKTWEKDIKIADGGQWPENVSLQLANIVLVYQISFLCIIRFLFSELRIRFFFSGLSDSFSLVY